MLERKPYTFLPTPTKVYGDNFTPAVMEAGVVVNQSIGIRFLREEKANFYILEFLPIVDRIVMARFEEPVQLKQGYRYEDASNLTFLFRTGEEQRGRALFFQIECKNKKTKFETARKLGIQFS